MFAQDLDKFHNTHLSEIPIQRDLHAIPNNQGLPEPALYFGAFTMCLTKQNKNMAKLWIADASTLANLLEPAVENTKERNYAP